MPASVLQQAMAFPASATAIHDDDSDGSEALVSWLKAAFGVDAVAERFQGKASWIGVGMVWAYVWMCEGRWLRWRSVAIDGD